jgi:hypothetical protein
MFSLPSFHGLEFFHPVPKSGATPLLEKVEKSLTLVVSRDSPVSTGLKAQTPKWFSFADLSRKLEFPTAPPDFQRSLLLDLLSYKGV